MEHDTDTKHILVVEDEDELAEAIVTALTVAGGFSVERASDGKEGVEKALADHPDLILLDINLPSMSGVEAMQMIRSDEWGARVPIVLLTVEVNMDTVSEAIEAGGSNTSYLTKNNWSLEQVVAHVREKLG